MTHFSYSQVAKYASCPYAWWLEYKDDVAVRFNRLDARTEGKLVHLGVQSYLLGADWREAVQQEYFAITDTDNGSEGYEKIIENVPNYLEEVYPGYEVVEIKGVPAVEFKFTHTIMIGKRKVDFIGYIDLIIRTAEGETILIDWKTVQNTTLKISEFVQGAIYQYIMEVRYGIWIDKVVHFQLRRKPAKTKTTRMFVVTDFKFTNIQLQTWWDNAVIVMRRMLNSRLIHRSPSPRLCSMCDFKNICDAHVADDDNMVKFLMNTEYKVKGTPSGGKLVINGT